jgi:molybdopterin-guanine dinucleotide biosynthesis adapter protein
VTVVKHSHHPIDLPGADTDRFVRGGADAVVFASNRTVAFLPTDPLALARSLGTDVVLVEGFHRRPLGNRFRIRSPRESQSLAREIVAHLDRRLAPRRARRAR